MDKYKFINDKFPSVEYDDLKKIDKKAVAIIDSLLTGSDKVQLPLASAIDLDSQKDFTVDVKQLVRIQFAIYSISNIVFTTKTMKDADNKAYNVYFAESVDDCPELEELFTTAKKSESKRESSKKTSDRKIAREENRIAKIETKKNNEYGEAVKKAKDKTGDVYAPLVITALYDLQKVLKFKDADLEMVRTVLEKFESSVVTVALRDGSKYYGE